MNQIWLRLHQFRVSLQTLVATLGRSGQLLFHSLWFIPDFKKTFPLIIKQIYHEGVLSLLIIVLSALFIGMVIGLEGYNVLVGFGSESVLGQMIALSILRELGPVVSALLFAGRAGSALTAEIGHMKATEQLASMEMMGVDPLRRVIAPRLIGGFISLPILSVIFSVVGIWGGYLVGVKWLGVYEGSFWSNMQASVQFGEDVLNGIIKSIVFGIIVTWIAVFQGYDAKPTSLGISKATTNTVVFSSLAVLSMDFILTALMFGEY